MKQTMRIIENNTDILYEGGNYLWFCKEFLLGCVNPTLIPTQVNCMALHFPCALLKQARIGMCNKKS